MPESAQTECGCPACCCRSQAPPVFTVEPFPFDDTLPCFDIGAFIGHVDAAFKRLDARLTALEATIGKRAP